MSAADDPDPLFDRDRDRDLDPERTITVVSGLPRSGTSMMMQMLDAAGLEIASDGERVADADNPQGYFELEAVKRMREDVSFLADCVGKVVKIVAPLLPLLPDAYDYRVIFMERDLAAVLASQRDMMKRRGEEGDGVEDATMERAYSGLVEKVKREVLGGKENVKGVVVSYDRILAGSSGDVAAVAELLSDGDLAERDELVSRMAGVVDSRLRRH